MEKKEIRRVRRGITDYIVLLILPDGSVKRVDSVADIRKINKEFII